MVKKIVVTLLASILGLSGLDPAAGQPLINIPSAYPNFQPSLTTDPNRPIVVRSNNFDIYPLGFWLPYYKFLPPGVRTAHDTVEYRMPGWLLRIKNDGQLARLFIRLDGPINLNNIFRRINPTKLVYMVAFDRGDRLRLKPNGSVDYVTDTNSSGDVVYSDYLTSANFSNPIVKNALGWPVAAAYSIHRMNLQLRLDLTAITLYPVTIETEVAAY